jgi:hypothetical protein
LPLSINVLKIQTVIVIVIVGVTKGPGLVGEILGDAGFKGIKEAGASEKNCASAGSVGSELAQEP